MSAPLRTIYSSRSADKFVVRLPPGMRERIADVAKKLHRSMNSEIISRLEASLPIDSSVELGDSDSTHLSTQESRLIEVFRSLAPHQRAALMEIISIPAAGNTTTAAAND